MNDEFNRDEFNNSETDNQESGREELNNDTWNNSGFNGENNYYDGNHEYTSQTTGEVIDAKVVDNRVVDDVPKKKEKKPHKTLKAFTKVVAFGLTFGLVAGATLQGYNYFSGFGTSNSSLIGSTSAVQSDSSKVSTSTSNDAVAVNTGTNGITSDVSTVVENAMPSIVAINSVMTDTTTDFFGREYSQDVEGSGSGIIIGQNSSEILIATNNHVVENAKSVSIVFSDESKASATIKGTAPTSDLAVVAVKASDLSEKTLSTIKIATLGDSTKTKLGEMAIAIGNALGYGQSVTVGYISALNREVTVNDNTMKLIQTDAAINPGNSGGALLNSKGEVIGINSVKYVDTSVDSIGYAIPISDAIPIINELMNHTAVAESDSAYLGISGSDVTDVYSQSFGMPVGVYVGDVDSGSAADKAGIQKGDIIVAINKISVKTMSDLQEQLANIKAKSTGTVTVKYLNNGQYAEKTLNVTFGTKPSK